MRGIIAIARREFAFLRAERRLLFIILMLPVFYVLLFGMLYSQHVIKHIKTVVLDYSHSALSRSIVQAFSDSEKFAIIGYVADEKELQQCIENKKATAALVIPPDLEKNIKTGSGTNVLLIVNGTNMLFSNAAVTAANEIIGTFSTGMAVYGLENKGVPVDKALAAAQPVGIRLRIWYNPTFNYTNFLLLGLACTAVQQVALLYMAVAIVREKERGTIEELSARFKPYQVVLGKILTYFTVNFATFNLALAACFYLFAIPRHGSYLTINILYAAFLSTILSLGVFLSTICRSELEATQLAILLALPSFLFSGFTWPLEAMPTAARIISYFLPLTYFAPSIRDIALMGINLKQIGRDLAALSIMTLFLLPAAIMIAGRQFKAAGTTK